VIAVNLPVGSALNVVRIPINGGAAEIVGTIVPYALHSGLLFMDSALGTPPTPMFPGDVIEVLAGSQIILSGSF